MAPSTHCIRRLLDPSRPCEPMRTDTIFDIASLTKILAVWSAIGSPHPADARSPPHAGT